MKESPPLLSSSLFIHQEIGVSLLCVWIKAGDGWPFNEGMRLSMSGAGGLSMYDSPITRKVKWFYFLFRYFLIYFYCTPYCQYALFETIDNSNSLINTEDEEMIKSYLKMWRKKMSLSANIEHWSSNISCCAITAS